MSVARIASLLPSATEIAYALGLGDRVVGVSHGCDHPSAARTKPVLTRPRFVPDGLSSGEVDAAVRHALREFGSVYEVDTERLAEISTRVKAGAAALERDIFALAGEEILRGFDVT